MANYNPSYPADVVKQITIGSTTYALKDDTLRALIAGMNSDITENTLITAVTSESADADKLVTNAGIKAYVDQIAQSINAFDVVVYDTIADRPAASADTMYKIALVGGESPVSGVYLEFITVRSGSAGSYTYAWEEIGTSEVDLALYLKQTATVAGVSFGTGSAIAAADLSTAMDLKALAHKDSATGTVESADITGVQATGSSTGDINVTLKDATTAVEASITFTDLTVSGALSGASIQPQGSVTVEAAVSTEADAF